MIQRQEMLHCSKKDLNVVVIIKIESARNGLKAVIQMIKIATNLTWRSINKY